MSEHRATWKSKLRAEAAKRPPKGWWKMRDGTLIAIKDMSDSHLLNAIKMCERNGYISTRTLSFDVYGPQPQGDMASYYYEQELDAILRAPVSSKLDELEAEAERRGLEF